MDRTLNMAVKVSLETDNMKLVEEIGMEYIMHLAAEPFEKLRNGTKKIELRLYDEKRKRLKIGDSIIFVNLKDSTDTLKTKITDIYVFDSFEALYKALPLEDLGYSEDEIEQATPEDMIEFYTPEEQAEHGVIGIRLELLSYYHSEVKSLCAEDLGHGGKAVLPKKD